MLDQSISIHPYFKINKNKGNKFREICDLLVAKANVEKGCLNYGVSFNGDQAFFREAYTNAQAAINHLKNVENEIKELNNYAVLQRIEIHGSADQLKLIKDIVSEMNPVLFTLEKGFKK